MIGRRVKNKLRKNVRNFEENKMKEILKESGSIKKVRKELSKGRSMIIATENHKGKKEYNRAGTAEIATNYFKKLYSMEENNLEMKWAKVGVT